MRDTDGDGTPDYRDPNYPLTCSSDCEKCKRSDGNVVCTRCKSDFNLVNGACVQGSACSTPNCLSCGACAGGSSNLHACYDYTDDCSDADLCGKWPKAFSRHNWGGECCDSDSGCACDANSYVHMTYDDGVCRRCERYYSLDPSDNTCYADYVSAGLSDASFFSLCSPFRFLKCFLTTFEFSHFREINDWLFESFLPGTL